MNRSAAVRLVLWVSAVTQYPVEVQSNALTTQGHFTKHTYLGFFASNSNRNSSDITAGYFYPATTPHSRCNNRGAFLSQYHSVSYTN